MVIDETNLSVAWGKAFLSVWESKEIAPLVVTIRSMGSDEPAELPTIRQDLDRTLTSLGKQSCHTVANTIFPHNMWNDALNCDLLFKRYRRLIPFLKRHPANRNGLYFQRFIAYGCDKNAKGGVNQLEHIIRVWKTGHARRTALQAAVFDPHIDHTMQRQRGFPCLQQVAFAKDDTGGLAVTGVYATQYIVEKAYGNYLGLCRLGRFMAHEMGLPFSKVTCIATPAVRGNVAKYKLNSLYENVCTTLERPQLTLMAVDEGGHGG